MIQIIFMACILLAFLGLLILLKFFHKKNDVIRIWFPLAIIFTILVWFLRYDYGNYDDKAGYYMGSAVVRNAPESVKWLNSNMGNFLSKPKTERSKKRYHFYFGTIYNYFTLHHAVFFTDYLLSLFDHKNTQFDLKRAATSVAWGMGLSWIIHFIIFLLVLWNLSKEDPEILKCYIFGLFIIVFSIGYWEEFFGTINSPIFESTSRGTQSILSHLLLFILASSKRNVFIFLPITALMILSNFGSGSALSAIFLFITLFLFLSEREILPDYSSKYVQLGITFTLCFFVPFLATTIYNPFSGGGHVITSYFGVNRILSDEILSWRFFVALFLNITCFVFIFVIYKKYLKKFHKSRSALLLTRMFSMTFILIIITMEMRHFDTIFGTSFEFSYAERRLTPKVSLFILGTIALGILQLNIFYFTNFSRVIKNILIGIVFCYLSTQFVRVVLYQPWVSDQKMRITQKNIFELKLMRPVYNLITLRFFRDEREIFFNTWGIDMKNELTKDLNNLKWDDVPFTNKYETLIHLKISKMLLEDTYLL